MNRMRFTSLIILTSILLFSCSTSKDEKLKSVPKGGFVVFNNMFKGSRYPYLKVGQNMGGLSSGFTGSRSWGSSDSASIYACNLKNELAQCDHIIDVNFDPNADSTIKITGNKEIGLGVQCNNGVTKITYFTEGVTPKGCPANAK